MTILVSTYANRYQKKRKKYHPFRVMLEWGWSLMFLHSMWWMLLHTCNTADAVLSHTFYVWNLESHQLVPYYLANSFVLHVHCRMILPKPKALALTLSVKQIQIRACKFFRLQVVFLVLLPHNFQLFANFTKNLAVLYPVWVIFLALKKCIISYPNIFFLVIYSWSCVVILLFDSFSTQSFLWKLYLVELVFMYIRMYF